MRVRVSWCRARMVAGEIRPGPAVCGWASARTSGAESRGWPGCVSSAVPHPPPVDPLDVVWTGLGAGAGAGGALGGARVGDGGGALGWVEGGVEGRAAGGAAGALAGGLRCFFFLAAARCVGVGAGLGVCVGEATGDGLTAVWLAVWAGALRAKSTAKAAAVIALSWVVRQVSLERRRRPCVLLSPGFSRRRVG